MIASIIAVVLAFVQSAWSAQTDPIFAGGFETFPPASLTVHYPAGAHFITARGNAGGLSPTQGRTFSRAGDTFTLVLQVNTAAHWKPLLDDATYAIGPDYPVAPGERVEIWPHFTTAQGQVVTLIAAFHSTVLGNDRPIYAYLPPTYLENTDATFPVVYMHDGQNLWASLPLLATSATTWQVDTAFDAASNSGAFKEAIVIGIPHNASRIYEYTPTTDPQVAGGGGANLYLQMVAQELKPVVDNMLRTRAGASSTLMAGSSLGGLVSCYAGRTMPTVFGRIAALSPSSWWNNEVIVADVLGTPAAPNRPLLVYLDSGDSSDDGVVETNNLAAAYVSVGYDEGVDLLHLVQAGGLHNETFWAQRFPGAMQFLLGPRDQ